MKTVRSIGLAIAASITFITAAQAQFADSVVSYTSGNGYATEFGTGLGYTNASAALGEPSRVTPGQFGGPVDPFSPPYTRDQYVSLGDGGSLILHFNSPIQNRTVGNFGLDFMIFGAAGFIITNGDYSGGGITDGSLFSGNSGQLTVSVSVDGSTFYPLNTGLAASGLGSFPTDGSGSFQIAVDPSLTAASFAGKDMNGIRSLYNGSGGGMGYDIGWAGVPLSEINYVRIESAGGRAAIDGLAAVPEPGTWALLGLGALTVFAGRRKQHRVASIHS